MDKLKLVILLITLTAASAYAQDYGLQAPPQKHQHSRDLKTVRADIAPARAPAEPLENFRIEYAQGSYRLMQGSIAYSFPSFRSRQLKAIGAGNLITVTGATLHFVRVRLDDGETGYIPISAVELFRPANRDYWLTADSPVYQRPNLLSPPIAEVHRTRNAHVIGVELNYLKIRMRNGVEGYIPVSAVE